MKQIYLSRNRGRNSRVKSIGILLVVFICGAGIFYFLEQPIVSAGSSFWKAENFFIRSIRDKSELFRSKLALVGENAVLRDEIHYLESQLASLRYSRQESVPESAIITATVLARPPQTPYDIVIADIGSNATVKVGSKALLLKGGPLGTVFEVLGNQAKVKIFSTAGEETPAVLERNNMPATLIGSGGGNFKIIVPRDVAVEKGDKVLSADEKSELLAVVEDVNVRPTDSFKEVLAKSPVNIFTLRFILIVP